jgi:hypothetical protein
VSLGHIDEEQETKKLREKEISYKNQISNVWEREQKITEFK